MSKNFNSSSVLDSLPFNNMYLLFLCVLLFVSSTIFFIGANALAVITSYSPRLLFWVMVLFITVVFLSSSLWIAVLKK